MCNFKKNKSQSELEDNKSENNNSMNIQDNVDNKELKEDKTSAVVKEEEEEEILKVGKDFERMFRGIGYNKNFECVIDDYKLPKNSDEKDDSSYESYLFTYKNTKIKIKFCNNHHGDSLTFFLIDSNKEELKILSIWYDNGYAFPFIGEITPPYWDYKCLNEKFERFSINVMQHIMAELKNEEAKRIEYFESLISAEDLE